MINKQIITTPDGARLVVVPEEQFNDLLNAVEDKVDQVFVDEWRRDSASGLADDIPLDVMKALTTPGASKVKVWRKHRKMTAMQLADRAGLSKSYITHIEAGTRDGTVKALKSIAEALEVDLDDLA
jgi:DNA-binding XRE family transcriptional regulator